MERNRALALFLPLVAAIASAQGSSPESPGSLSFTLSPSTLLLSYFLPVFGMILLLFLLFSLANRALGHRFSFIEYGATALGVLLSVVLILAGLIFLAAFGALAWGIATRDGTFARAPEWAVPLADEVQYRALPILEMVLGSDLGVNTDLLRTVILGLLLVGGGLLFVLGILLLLRLPKDPFYELMASRRGPITFREVMTRGHEPLSPTVTFRVIDRHTNQPSPDVKVILKHKEGGKIYTRYTDFNGEVIFQKIDGLFSQYYAYVEGDEERKKYFVIRTAIGAETVT